MAENPPYPISNTAKLRLDNLYVVAHAVRGRSKEDANQAQSENEAASSNPFNSQSHLGFQICKALRNSDDMIAPQKQMTHHPSNIIISKMATRRPLQKNTVNSKDEFDLSKLRKIKLQPPVWREKENHRKRMLSAYFHNRRKIEEYQAMKAKMKCPRYNPNNLLRKEQNTSHIQEFPQLYNNGCRNKPLSEDPFPDDASNNVPLENISVENEKQFVFNPILADCSQPKFVWDPVILPPPKSFMSTREILEICSSPFEDRFGDSPGNRTTSSASSGLTVAEETLRLTCYAGRFMAPSNNQCRSRRSGNYTISSDYKENYDLESPPQSCPLDLVQHSQSRLRQCCQSDLEWLPQSRQPDLERLRQCHQSDLEWRPQSRQCDLERFSQSRPPDLERLPQSRQPDLERLRHRREPDLEWLPQSCQSDLEWHPLSRQPDLERLPQSRQPDLERLRQCRQSDLEWQPQSRQRDLERLSKSRQPDLERLRHRRQPDLEWLPQSCQPDLEWLPQSRNADVERLEQSCLPDFLDSSEE